MIRIFVVALLALVVAPAAADAATLTPTTAFASNNRQVNAGPATARTYTVTNNTATPLDVTAVALSGGDAAQFGLSGDTCTGHTFAQNETCTVAVAFNPTTTGARSTTLQVSTSAGTLTSAAITGTGRNLHFSVPTVDLGEWAVGATSDPGTLTIRNDDGASYTLGNLNTPTGFTKENDTCSGVALTAGAECTVAYRVKPTAPGPLTSNITIASYGPVGATVRGTGVQAAAAIAPATRAFPLTALAATSATQTFTLANTTNGKLDVGTVELTGPDAGQFQIVADGCSDEEVGKGSNCTVGVAFMPSAAGWKTASLAIPMAAPGGTVRARVSGRGGTGGTDTNVFTDFALGEQPLVRLYGDGEDGAGGALASGPCDVNGDGFDDFIAGASTWSRTPAALSWEGAGYVYLGGQTPGAADLASPPAGRVVRLEGEKEGAQTGLGIGCAGDVNDDGFDDVVIGGWAYEYPGRPTGTAAPRGIAYVVFGSDDFGDRSPVDLGRLGTGGFRIEAIDDDAYDHLGFKATGVGDVNDDGRDDIALMANTGDSLGRSNNGTTVVVAGRTSTATVTLGEPDSALLTINGVTPGQGNDIAGVGDVNGDDVPDIGVSSMTAVAFGRSTASGATWVVSGAKRGAIDLADSGSYLFAVGGAFAGHRAGTAVKGAGDVNSDGLADIVIGADSTAGANSDAAYVVYGSETVTPTMLDGADLGARGYRILGAPGTSTGFGVDGIGDVDDDGDDDIVVTGYASDGPAGNGAGRAWIVYGVADPATLPANDASSGLVPANANDHTRYVSLAALTAAQGSVLDGPTANERFGRAAAGVGDIDGNGANDVAFGSDSAFRHGRTGAGEATVALLPGPAPAAPPVVVDPDPDPGTGDPGTGDPGTGDPGTGDPGTADPGTGNPGTGTPSTPSAGGETPQPAPVNRAIPGLTVHRITVTRSGWVRLTVRCANASRRCTGNGSLTLGSRRVGAIKFAAPAGGSRTVQVRLSRTLRNALAKRGKLTGELKLNAWVDGHTGVVRRTVAVIAVAAR